MAEAYYPPRLAALQRWMAAVIRDPGDAESGIRSAAARRQVDADRALAGDVVVPSATLAPAGRLDVYHGSYLSRLVECLETDYSGLAHALGDRGRFVDLVADYVAQHPSRHPNLIFLGDDLPAFLRGRTDLEHREFLVELATLELAMTRAFHTPPFEPLDVRAFAGVPQDRWATAVLRPNPSLRLLELHYPANGYLQAVFDGGDPEIPAPAATRVAVYRKDHRVWRLTLSEPAFATLRALVRATPFEEALAHAGDELDRVGGWFREWAADGLFAGVELG